MEVTHVKKVQVALPVSTELTTSFMFPGKLARMTFLASRFERAERNEAWRLRRSEGIRRVRGNVLQPPTSMVTQLPRVWSLQMRMVAALARPRRAMAMTVKDFILRIVGLGLVSRVD